MTEQLAGGKLLLDSPAEAVARLRISNPERRNALDHEILDALAETLPRLDRGIETRCVLITGAPPVFSAGYDIASIPDRDLRARRRGARRPPLPRRDGGARRPTPGRPSRRSTATASAAASSWRSPATCGSAPTGAKLGMPPAKLGLDLRPHRPAQVPRHGRPAADQGAVPHRAQLRGGAGRARSASSTRSSPTTSSRAPAVELAAAIAANAPLSMRGNKQRDRAAQREPGPQPEQQEAGLVALRESCFASDGLPRGHPGLRREAQAALDGHDERRRRRKALAATDPTMAALIERVGEIDLDDPAAAAQRGARRADAYGALLRAIVGQQLSTKAARTIYGRVLDLFDGSTPSPEQLLEASEKDLRGGGPLRPQGRVHPRPRRARDRRRARARPPRRARRRGGDRGDRRRPRPRPVDGGDVPDLPPRTPRRPLRRRPRHPQGDPDRVRARGDADADRGDRDRRALAARTAASPRSTSGSRSPRSRTSSSAAGPVAESRTRPAEPSNSGRERAPDASPLTRAWWARWAASGSG